MLACSCALTRRFLGRIPRWKERNYGTKTYEGEGKTTMHILNTEPGLGLMINGFSQVGFRLNNDITILGPMIIFPRSVLSWQVGTIYDVNEDSLAIFPIIEPKIDIIVMGIGDSQKDLSFHKKILPFVRKYKLNVEILPTDQACSTFNFLNSEGRYVAGAMIPPTHILATDDDLVRSKMRYQNLYEVE